MRFFFAFLISIQASALVARAEATPTQVHDQILHTLNFATGKIEDIHTLAAGKTNAVIFMSSQCHCSQSHLNHIKNLKTEFPDVHFVIVDSNVDENAEEAHSYFGKTDLGITVIQDQKFTVADQFKAYRTPHSYLTDGDGNILYSGGISDSNDFDRAKHFYLREALTAVVKDHKKPELTYARALGCEIKR